MLEVRPMWLADRVAIHRLHAALDAGDIQPPGRLLVAQHASETIWGNRVAPDLIGPVSKCAHHLQGSERPLRLDYQTIRGS